MDTKRSHLTYALKDGIITHISKVKRGLKCECSCPACGEKLIARKGQRVMHHFAHQTAKECEYGYESSLHFAAKEILSRSKRMIIPSVYIRFPNSYKEDILLCDAKEITIDHVELEQRFNNIVPDVVAYVGAKCLFIEIFVTHHIDKEKINKLRAADISTIEIDLSKIDHSITTEELTTLLTENGESKYWIYNALDESHVITFMKENIGSLHFGNTEGSNTMEGQDILVVGTPYHADFLYKLIAFTLGYDFDEDEKMTPQVICRNGYRAQINTYKNENLQKVHLWMMGSELDQAAGRARLLRHDCTVHLFSRFPMKQAEIVKGFDYGKE